MTEAPHDPCPAFNREIEQALRDHAARGGDPKKHPLQVVTLDGHGIETRHQYPDGRPVLTPFNPRAVGETYAAVKERLNALPTTAGLLARAEANGYALVMAPTLFRGDRPGVNEDMGLMRYKAYPRGGASKPLKEWVKHYPGPQNDIGLNSRYDAAALTPVAAHELVHADQEMRGLKVDGSLTIPAQFAMTLYTEGPAHAVGIQTGFMALARGEQDGENSWKSVSEPPTGFPKSAKAFLESTVALAAPKAGVDPKQGLAGFDLSNEAHRKALMAAADDDHVLRTTALTWMKDTEFNRSNYERTNRTFIEKVFNGWDLDDTFSKDLKDIEKDLLACGQIGDRNIFMITEGGQAKPAFSVLDPALVKPSDAYLDYIRGPLANRLRTGGHTHPNNHGPMSINDSAILLGKPAASPDKTIQGSPVPELLAHAQGR